MIDYPDWSAFYLWKNGEPVPETAARCPRTLEALPSPTAAELARARELRQQLAKEDSFLEYLIDVQRSYGISSYL